MAESTGTETAQTGLLEGIRVVEIGDRVASAVVGMLLGEQGAEVIRITDPGRSCEDPVLEALLARGKTEASLELATDGGKAIDMFRAHAGDIKAVLLDLTMPVMDGTEVLGKLFAIRTDIPVLLASGYTSHEAVSHFSDTGKVVFLHKPYGRQELIGLLRSLLEEA